MKNTKNTTDMKNITNTHTNTHTHEENTLSKAKHTPGPWSVWNFSDSEIDVAIGPDVGGVAVAQVVTTNARGIATDQTRDTAQANAALMAAAPELLEYLQYAVWAHPELAKNEKLMAVIAKATAQQ